MNLYLKYVKLKLMNQKGFTLILVILGMILVVGIAASAFYLGTVKNNTQSQNQSNALSTAPSQAPITTPVRNAVNKIAYVKDTYKDNAEVIVKFLDGNKEFKTGIPIKWQDPDATWCQGFDWTSDGEKIVARIGKNISIFDTETEKLTSLFSFQPNFISTYQWDPLNKGLYYSVGSEEGTWFYSLNDTKSTKISNYSLLSTGRPVSFDGKKIVFSKEAGIKDPFGNRIISLVVLDVDSKNETEIKLPDNASKMNPFMMSAVWSPDSKNVAYVYETNTNDSKIPNKEGLTGSYRHIALFNLASQTTKELSELSLKSNSVENPLFSPDGKYLMFAIGQALWKANADGTNPVEIVTPNVNLYHLPSWSPDSKRIVLEKYNEGILVINNDGSNKILLDKDGSCPIWSPQ